jgi:acetyl-CoA carboxylase beta subunit
MLISPQTHMPRLLRKIKRGIDHAIKTKALLMISKSGGVRMMEAAYSLMY